MNMKINIEEFLDRWAGEIYPSKDEFLKALNSGKLVIYHGVDPTAPDLHLGHSTNYLLLKKFQEMGHKIILLIGDFTAQIGDPTGKSSTRKALSKQEVKKNYKTYEKQVGKILDLKKIQVKFNSKWLSKMNLADVCKLSASFTHGKMIKRNMFQERLKNGQEIYLNEFLYPLLQGYDSVAMDVDAEVGGTDQTFNMLVGRELLKKYKDKEKFIITTLLLENPKTGKKLMSKSEGGYIGLNDSFDSMFGKTMALPDEAIVPVFRFCTEYPMPEIIQMGKDLNENKINPRNLKVKLAKEIVKMYFSLKEAEKAESNFENVFKKNQMPEQIPEINIEETKMSILDLLVKTRIALTKSEAKRLVIQKGVKIDGRVEEEWQKTIEIKKGMIIQAGKRRFAKII
jgi:tyrosyl-tRNA synthetase